MLKVTDSKNKNDSKKRNGVFVPLFYFYTYETIF